MMLVFERTDWSVDRFGRDVEHLGQSYFRADYPVYSHSQHLRLRLVDCLQVDSDQMNFARSAHSLHSHLPAGSACSCLNCFECWLADFDCLPGDCYLVRLMKAVHYSLVGYYCSLVHYFVLVGHPDGYFGQLAYYLPSLVG